MARVIDLRQSAGGQLIILGEAIALPNSNTALFSSPYPLVAGSMRYNPDTDRIEFISSDSTSWRGVDASYEKITQQAVILHTLDPSDGSYLRMTASGASKLVIPRDADINFPVGSRARVVRAGTGTLSVEGDIGVTVNATAPTLRARYSAATVTKIGANVWDMAGDLG